LGQEIFSVKSIGYDAKGEEGVEIAIIIAICDAFL